MTLDMDSRIIAPEPSRQRHEERTEYRQGLGPLAAERKPRHRALHVSTPLPVGIFKSYNPVVQTFWEKRTMEIIVLLEPVEGGFRTKPGSRSICAQKDQTRRRPPGNLAFCLTG